MARAPHIPVLRDEVVALIEPRDDAIYVDGTLGACGYAAALLDAADCRVYGIDRDPAAIENARSLAKKWDGRLIPVEGCFGDMEALLSAHAVIAVDGVALDLGVSSMQLDQAGRGFSFLRDGPLDMRMAATGRSAADVVNETPEGELADIIYTYGEERRARQVARAIANARRDAPITRTLQLAEIVHGAFPAKERPKAGRHAAGRNRIDPATRTFQAIRIYVNDELGELERGLAAAERLLTPGGRLAVVSFHSLEDRRVKEFLRARSGQNPRKSRHLPDAADDGQAGPGPSFRMLTRRPVTADEAEVAANPRARSARLRAAERLDAPVWTGHRNGEIR